MVEPLFGGEPGHYSEESLGEALTPHSPRPLRIGRSCGRMGSQGMPDKRVLKELGRKLEEV